VSRPRLSDRADETVIKNGKEVTIMTDTATEQTANSATATTEAPATETKAAKAKRPYVFTPFQAMKVVNDMLAKAGVDRALQGPMLYAYGAQGKFTVAPAQVDVEAGVEKPRQEVDEKSFTEWAEAFVEAAKSGKKNTAKASTETDTEAGAEDELDETDEVDDENEVDDDDESDEEEDDTDDDTEDESDEEGLADEAE
jgi:hypothetical protein